MQQEVLQYDILGQGATNPAFATIEYNDIHNNYATRSGGAIAVFKGSDVDIRNNSINNNSAKCDVSGSNPYFIGGGGIVIGLFSKCEISYNTISDNQAAFNPYSTDITGLGGGILIRLGSNVSNI